MRIAISVNSRRGPNASFVSNPAENPWIFGGGEEQGSERRPRRKAGAKLSGLCDEPGQAEKSARGMPWHQEPTKDVTSCDKLRLGANIR